MTSFVPHERRIAFNVSPSNLSRFSGIRLSHRGVGILRGVRWLFNGRRQGLRRSTQGDLVGGEIHICEMRLHLARIYSIRTPR
jgi:hypothetical protein